MNQSAVSTAAACREYWDKVNGHLRLTTIDTQSESHGDLLRACVHYAIILSSLRLIFRASIDWLLSFVSKESLETLQYAPVFHRGQRVFLFDAHNLESNTWSEIGHISWSNFNLWQFNLKILPNTYLFSNFRHFYETSANRIKIKRCFLQIDCRSNSE